MSKILLKDKVITVLTGAGFSKASGIPTFRGEDGLWKTYKAEDLATPYAFARNPELVWEWYKWRINLILNSKPNPAHQILAEIEKQGVNLTIITQNVDDLHDRVSKNVIHVHGEIRKAICTKCSDEISWTRDSLVETESVPKCKSCGGYYRPNVVWFGEQLDSQTINQCADQLQRTDILIIAGTSGIVYPVADFPFFAKRNNPQLQIFEFNIEETPISSIASETLLGPVEITLVKFLRNRIL
jgi:NAD-dependent deacetylase